jgi:hypothetical protein
MASWDSFFQAQVGASATLAGLVFVGVSINLTKIIASDHLPNRALEALFVLWTNLVLSSLYLVPGQGLGVYGIEVIASGLVLWPVVSLLHFRSMRTIEPEFRRHGAVAAIQGHLFVLLVIAVGVAIVLKGPPGVYGLVSVLLLGYFLALSNAWVLTIEINR